MSTDMSLEKPSPELIEFEKLPRVDLDNFKRQLLRGRLQPLLPRQGQPPRRPDLLPGSCRARVLQPGVPRGTDLAVAARALPPRGGARAGPVVLPASPADAGVLGVPHGVDWA